MSRLLIVLTWLLLLLHSSLALQVRVSSRSSASICSRSRSKNIARLNLFDGLKKMVGAVDTGEQLAMDNEKLIKKYMNIVNDINKLEVV